MRKRPYMGEAVPFNEQPHKSLRPQLGSVKLTLVEHHVHPLFSDDNGSSIGMQIDNLLHEAAMEQRIVQDVAVHLFPDQLDTVTGYYRGDAAPSGDE
jgi:hypothetical protein